jgi:hypothetical protein
MKASSSRSDDATKASKHRKSLHSEDRHILHAGWWFALTYELWVDRSILDLECPANLDPLNPCRYEDSTLQNLAIIAEVHMSLTLSLRACLTSKDRHESFKNIVRHNTLFYFKCSNRSLCHKSSSPNTIKSGLTWSTMCVKSSVNSLGLVSNARHSNHRLLAVEVTPNCEPFCKIQ